MTPSHPNPDKATMRPWVLYPFDCTLHDSCEGHVDIHDGNGDLINGVPFARSDRRAALIVEAVNSFASLKARVLELEGVLKWIAEWAEVRPREHQCSGIHCSTCAFGLVIEKARTTLNSMGEK